MKKYKLLRFGHCYINPDGSFVVGLLKGTKKKGYYFAASHAVPNAVCLGKIMILTRIVPNDGYWTEIPMDAFCKVFDLSCRWVQSRTRSLRSGSVVISKY